MFTFKVILFISFIHIISCGIGDTIYTSTLSPNQVVGSYISGNNENSVGTCVCNINRYSNPPQISCNIQHNVNELTSAAVKSGKSGTNGNSITEINILTGLHLSFVIDLETSTALQNVLDGLWYIELYTVDYPNGELRGQIEHRDRFYSVLNVQNTIPRSSGSDGSGYALGSYSPTFRILDFDLVHDVTLPLGTDLYSGLPGTIGDYKATFPGTSPLFKSVDLTRSEDTDLLEDLLYLNIRSTANPQGDIRGQWISIDYINEGAFTSLLLGGNSGNNSPAVGIAISTFNCQTDFMEYIIMHNVDTPLSGLVYSETGILFSLPSGNSPIYGKIQLLPNEVTSLYNEGLSVSIQSSNANDPTGEISGVLSNEYDLFSYLSGTNVVPPVTTHYVGTMLLRFVDDNIFQYELIHNVGDAIDIVIMLGFDGENTNTELYSIPVVNSPTNGEIQISTETERNALLSGATYIEIRTRQFPFGVIRGSIKVLNPCDVVYDYEISLPDDSVGTLRSSDTSVLSYISYIDKDDDEFDVYVNVINSGSFISLLLYRTISTITLLWCFIIFI